MTCIAMVNNKYKYKYKIKPQNLCKHKQIQTDKKTCYYVRVSFYTSFTVQFVFLTGFTFCYLDCFKNDEFKSLNIRINMITY